MSDKREEVFLFMLQEHEIYHGMFERHYRATERAISFYFVLIAGIMSLNGFLMTDGKSFSLFNLSDMQLCSCLFLGGFGVVVIFNVLEHRLLMLKYVKNVNMNRQWFHERYSNEELARYTLFLTGGRTPHLYVKYQPFWWEMLGLVIIVSIFLALLAIGLVQELGYTSSYYKQVNGVALILLTLGLTLLLMLAYKRRSVNTEKNILDQITGSGKKANANLNEETNATPS